jgi:hypothetical protein
MVLIYVHIHASYPSSLALSFAGSSGSSKLERGLGCGVFRGGSSGGSSKFEFPGAAGRTDFTASFPAGSGLA